MAATHKKQSQSAAVLKQNQGQTVYTLKSGFSCAELRTQTVKSLDPLFYIIN